jgi:hypothetical protein
MMILSSLMGTDYIIARRSLYYNRYLSRSRCAQCDIRQFPFIVVRLDHAENRTMSTSPQKVIDVLTLTMR